MMTNPLPPQAHDLIGLFTQVLSDPQKHKSLLAELASAMKEAKATFDSASAERAAADEALKQAKKFDGQAKADAIARETALKQREDALVTAEDDFARKHEGHTFELRALERKKAELQDREQKHQQDASQLLGFVAALDAREQALARREAAVNDLDAKNKAFAADLARKKAHLDNIFAA